MKHYTKAELEFLLLEKKDIILTSCTEFGDVDRSDDEDDTGFGRFGLLG